MPIGAANRLVQLEKEYYAGAHLFTTVINATDATPLEQLVTLSNLNILSIRNSNVGIGTTFPKTVLDIQSKDAIQLPAGLDTDRPNARPGMLRFNTSVQQFEGYGNGDWSFFGAIKNKAGDTYILPEYPNQDDKGLHFYTSNLERLIINRDGNIGIGTTLPRQTLDVIGNTIVMGNIGIGTTISLKPLHVESGAIFMNGNIGFGQSNPQYTVDIQGDLKTDTLITTNVSICNLTVSGAVFASQDSLTFRNNIQLKPIHHTVVVPTENVTEFTVSYSGQYKVYPENTEVYLNGYKMAYKSSNLKDYDVSYSNDYNNLVTQFTLTMENEVHTGDILDICFWPTYLDPNGLLQPGYTLQTVQYSYWQLAYLTSNIYYLDGNIGIGTNQPNHLFEVQGDGYIRELFTSNLNASQSMVIGSNVGIQTSQPVVSLDIRSTDGIRIPVGTTQQRPTEETGIIRYNTTRNLFEGYNQSGWVSLGGVQSQDDGSKITPELLPGCNDQTLRFYTNSNIQMVLNSVGNLGIGSEQPSQQLDVQGSMMVSGNLVINGPLQANGSLQTGSLNVSGTLLTDQTIVASNVYVMGKLEFGDASSNLKSRLQVHPIRQVFYVQSESQQSFVMTASGIYGVAASNVDIFLGQSLLSYYSSNIKDYDVSYVNSYLNFNTTYTITLTRPAQYGDVLDITVWPQILQDSGPIEGYAYQQVRVTDTYFLPINENVYYLGNVGIGTTQTQFGKLTVAGHIVPSDTHVYNLGSSNLRFKDIYLSGNSIYLEDSIIRRDNTGKIELVNSNNEPVDLRVNQLVSTSIGIGTTNLTEAFQMIGNVLISGNVGIGTTISKETLHVEGDFLAYGSMTLSNVSTNIQPSMVLYQSNSNQPILQCFNTQTYSCNLVATLSHEGNLYLQGPHVMLGRDSSPVLTTSGIIGQENLYTWWGDDTIVDVANESQAGSIKEPFWKVFSGFTSTYFNRIQAQGSAQLLTNYYTSLYNLQYSLYFSALSQDSITSDGSPEITTVIPVNYISIRLPIKPGFSHSFFLKLRCYDLFQAATVFVTNTAFNSFYRLNAQSVTTRDAFLNTSWVGPNGENSSSHQYYEWVMFTIPKYVVDQYAYDEFYDNKSRYRKNIILCVMSNYGNASTNLLYCTGIAMRTNPYHICFHNARNIFSRVNGGNPANADRTFANTDNYEGRMEFYSNRVFNHVRVPICPPKDPNGNSFPDYYLVWIGHYSDPYGGPSVYISLQNPTNTSDRQLLGRFSKCIKGRYGNFLSEIYRVALGFIIPSPDPKYIVYVGNQPYLNLYIDNNSFGLGGSSYTRGFFTEVIDERGPIGVYTRYTNTPLQWLTIPSIPISGYLPVTSGLTAFLDPELFDISSSIWRDFSGNYYDFTVNSSALQTVNNIKHFNFEGGFGAAKRVVNGSLVDVPSFVNGTMIVFSTVIAVVSNYRSLTRGVSYDHQAMTIGSDLLGFFDNNVSGQLNSTFNVTNLPSYNTQFNMLVFRLSRTAPQWQFQYNLNNIVYSVINNNAAYNDGFCCIGAYHNGTIDVNNNTGPWGKIAHFLYYNRALSTQEILQVYNHYRSRFGLSEDTYLGSYNFRISHPDGRTLKYDSGANIIRLNSGVDFTFDVYKSPEANFNYSRNRIGLKRSGTNEHMYHSASAIPSICRMTANYGTGGEWSWAFLATSNQAIYQIRNDYNNTEYYLGYDTISDQVCVVDAKDIRRVAGWTVTPSLDSTNIVSMPMTYPLDQLSVSGRGSLRGGYSLKRLSINYTGPMVNVRRSTDNATLDFYGDVYGRLGSTVNGGGSNILNWLGAANGFVTTWYDQSGSNNHATQSSTNLQPQLQPNGVLVDFLTTSYMTLPSNTVPVGTDLPYTYVVRHGNIRSSYGGFIGAGTWATNYAANTFRFDTGYYRSWWWGRDYTYGTLAGGNVSSIVYDRVNRYGYVNGVGFSALASSGGYSVAPGTQYIGQSHSQEPMNGELYYVLIFGTNLTNDDRAKCEEII